MPKVCNLCIRLVWLCHHNMVMMLQKQHIPLWLGYQIAILCVFCRQNDLCTLFVAKTIYAFRLESFCALNFAIRKVQTFGASGLDWAGQIVYSLAAPLPCIKVIYTNCLCLYSKRRDFFVFFSSPPWNSLSNTVAERRAKGLSMDALTPPTIAHNGCLLHCLHHHRHIEIWAHHVFRFTNMGAERKTCLGLPDRW